MREKSIIIVCMTRINYIYLQMSNNIITLSLYLPVDYNRIILPTLPGIPGSDYINGNYVKVGKPSCAKLKMFIVQNNLVQS